EGLPGSDLELDFDHECLYDLQDRRRPGAPGVPAGGPRGAAPACPRRRRRPQEEAARASGTSRRTRDFHYTTSWSTSWRMGSAGP
ncbi:unnamed protein product, partial [Prorocentrum cordatum]